MVNKETKVPALTEPQTIGKVDAWDRCVGTCWD